MTRNLTPAQNAVRLAEEGVEALLCNSRLIKEICQAFGCDDPEGVAPYVDTETLIRTMSRAIVADIVRAGRASLSASDFPETINLD